MPLLYVTAPVPPQVFAPVEAICTPLGIVWVNATPDSELPPLGLVIANVKFVVTLIGTGVAAGSSVNTGGSGAACAAAGPARMPRQSVASTRRRSVRAGKTVKWGDVVLMSGRAARIHPWTMCTGPAPVIDAARSALRAREATFSGV